MTLRFALLKPPCVVRAFATAAAGVSGPRTTTDVTAVTASTAPATTTAATVITRPRLRPRSRDGGNDGCGRRCLVMGEGAGRACGGGGIDIRVGGLQRRRQRSSEANGRM